MQTSCLTNISKLRKIPISGPEIILWVRQLVCIWPNESEPQNPTWSSEPQQGWSLSWALHPKKSWDHMCCPQTNKQKKTWTKDKTIFKIWDHIYCNGGGFWFNSVWGYIWYALSLFPAVFRKPCGSGNQTLASYMQSVYSVHDSIFSN